MTKDWHPKYRENFQNSTVRKKKKKYDLMGQKLKRYLTKEDKQKENKHEKDVTHRLSSENANEILM